MSELEDAHRILAHRGIDGMCRCPRCLGCETLLPADRICLRCAPSPDEILGLDGPPLTPGEAEELAQRVFARQFPNGAPERYSPARYIAALSSPTTKPEPQNHHEEAEPMPTRLAAEAGARGYRAIPVDITDIRTWSGVIAIDGPGGYRELSRHRKSLLLVLHEPKMARALGVPISQEAAFDVVRYTTAKQHEQCLAGHLGNSYTVLLTAF
ncbi:MAG: hypothetical protein F4121_03015 [Acidimicrobiia bacterium]|nr:hypothetical protein [Acidimicrobiia bacterium]MYC46371.1 hypothetical protein [Acidimicrobiia bacterium]MYI19075.1 hypothetical protein [Acidimicrobiia bacterium]